MIVPVLRVVASVVLALALWWAWRSLRYDRVVALIVGVGFVGRALAGAALFWVSYLELPVGASLQLGDGLWFYALDGQSYFRWAQDAAAGGTGAIWNADPALPSVAYLQALALTMYLVGPVASAALALNLVSYMATCWAIIWIGRRLEASRPALLLALGGVSLLPSWILWSTQPLKDTFFIACVVGFVAPLVVWFEWLRGGGRVRGRTVLVALAGLWVLYYAIAGVRWYFALLVLPAIAVGSAVPVRHRSSGRLGAGLCAAAAMLVLAETVPLAAGPYVPAWIHDVLRPSSVGRVLAAAVRGPQDTLDSVHRARLGHAVAGGGTEIRVPGRDVPLDIVRADTVDLVRGYETVAVWSSLSAGEKILVGGVAMLVPRALAEPLGWIEIGGGRGLFLFADADTLLLDAAVLAALALILWQWRRRREPHAAFWFALAMTILVAVPLAYQAGNFGTLFRQRNMVAVGVVLLPLLMTPRPAATGADR